MHHYVYQIDSITSGEYYIGVRSSESSPLLDKYNGSGAWCRDVRKAAMPTTKTILSEHPSRDSAADEELKQICLNWGKPGFMNRARTSVIPKFGPRIEKRNYGQEFIYTPVWNASLSVRVLWVTMMAFSDDIGVVFVHPSILRQRAQLDSGEFFAAIKSLENLEVIRKIGEVYEFVNYKQNPFYTCT